MDTNEYLRQRALRLSNLGITHKVLAGKMGMAPSTFSKWLNQKEGIGPASTVALDGLYAYVQELLDALTEDGVASYHDAHTDSVPGAAHSVDRGTFADIVDVTRTIERATGGLAAGDRAARKHPAAPRAEAPGRRDRVGKHRR